MKRWIAPTVALLVIAVLATWLVGFQQAPGSAAASEPGIAVADAGAIPAADQARPVYSCPMHPEVKQDKPGNCPKCGMTLVLQKPPSK